MEECSEMKTSQVELGRLNKIVTVTSVFKES